MFPKERRGLSVYIFSRKGVPLLALPAEGRLPMEPSQVEGVLAVAGGFDPLDEGEDYRRTRARYDEYGILGLRGEHAVVAMVSPDGLGDDLLPELERFLKRCDRRLRRVTTR